MYSRTLLYYFVNYPLNKNDPQVYSPSPPGAYFTPMYQRMGMVEWWYRCRNVIWLFFLRNMKNTWKITMGQLQKIFSTWNILTMKYSQHWNTLNMKYSQTWKVLNGSFLNMKYSQHAIFSTWNNLTMSYQYSKHENMHDLQWFILFNQKDFVNALAM